MNEIKQRNAQFEMKASGFLLESSRLRNIGLEREGARDVPQHL